MDHSSYAGPMPSGSGAPWPAPPVETWQETRDTLHLVTQIVGKVCLALAPPVNHWWHVPLYVNSCGLTTSLLPHRGMGVEITLDFTAHQVEIRTTAGTRYRVALGPRSVADFYAEFRVLMDELGIDAPVLPRPVELPESIPFAEDTRHACYDPAAVHAFWRCLVAGHRVLSRFRGEFRGKCSPVHFFWGSFDLAVSRFSGRPAPHYRGGKVPHVADWVMVEAYRDELSSCGYWPGGGPEGMFYAYAYPEPDGFRTWPVAPTDAYFDESVGEFLLPYGAVRSAPDPDEHLLTFLRSTHEATAVLGRWPT